MSSHANGGIQVRTTRFATTPAAPITVHPATIILFARLIAVKAAICLQRCLQFGALPCVVYPMVTYAEARPNLEPMGIPLCDIELQETKLFVD